MPKSQSRSHFRDMFIKIFLKEHIKTFIKRTHQNFYVQDQPVKPFLLTCRQNFDVDIEFFFYQKWFQTKNHKGEIIKLYLKKIPDDFVVGRD